jgi:hypothetical protein
MKKTLLIITALVLFPVFSFSASLEPPWKCVIKNQKYELWYDTSQVKKSDGFIDVYTWEIYKDDGRAVHRHEKYNRSNGQVAFGKCTGYKGERQVTEMDLSKVSGFMFMPPEKERKKLFKILNR